MSTTLTAPVAYPKVTVGGVSYFLKFGFGALYELNGRGFNVAKTREAAKAYEDKEQWLRLMLDLGSCALGNVDSSGNWTSTPMASMQLADRLRDEEFQTFCEAVQESFWGKPSPAPTESAAAGDTSNSSTKDGGSTPGVSLSPEMVSG